MDPQAWPVAEAGGLYTVVFAGANMKAGNDDNSVPEGEWQAIWAPFDDELMHADSNITTAVVVEPEWCYTGAGFNYLVGCLTTDRVLAGSSGMQVAPPPFNDRCVAVGGSCGGACGSSGSEYASAKSKCPGYHQPSDAFGFLNSRKLGESPLFTSRIPHDQLVSDIEPLKSRNLGDPFFHLYIIAFTMTFFVQLITFFPGNFRAYFPTHTWEEIKDHSYIMDEFSAVVAFGVSKGEGKFFVLRNWLGKISSVPRFQDKDGAVFRRGGMDTTKWCDVFADEGHREGARLLFTAWCTSFKASLQPHSLKLGRKIFAMLYGQKQSLSLALIWHGHSWMERLDLSCLSLMSKLVRCSLI
jgi:hypothetical protein